MISKEEVLTKIDFRSYFLEHIQKLKSAGSGQSLGVCPFHGDTHSSFSLNIESGLWNCKGCGEKGDVFTFHQKIHHFAGFKETIADLAKRYGVEMEHKQKPGSKEKNGQGRGRRGLDMDLVEKLHQALLADPPALEKLILSRGLTQETIKKYKLGVSTQRRRLSIPVFDEHGQVINIRLYSSTNEFKVISWGKGFGQATIYGLDALKDYPLNEDLIICEGEFDRLLLCQAGFNAVTHTNGALSFQREWIEFFKGRQVVLIYDADEGGRQGQEKTARYISGVVKSLRVVDLKAAGLVDGTAGSKDVSDFASDCPGWPRALREAVEATQPMDLSELAPPDPFVRLFEKDGGYWKVKKDVDVPISNFLIKPIRSVRVERQEILEAQVVSGKAKNGLANMEVSFYPTHWATKAAFKRALGVLGPGYVGSEDDIQELKVHLSNKPFPRFQAKNKLGLHTQGDGWIFVATDRALTKDGEVEDLVYFTDQPTKIQYDTSFITPAAPEETAQVARALVEYNEPDIVGAVLAWMTALPFRARIISALPHLQRQFPLLLLWGERGAGKTKTVETVLLPFFGCFSGPSKIDEMTKFTFMLNANATNLIPLAFDEYKPSKLSQRQVAEVSGFCRSVYDATTGQRGYSGPEGLGARIYTYTAPVVIMGEQTLAESALKDRIIEVTFSIQKRLGRRIEEIQDLNLAGVGLNYIRWTLGVTDREVAEAWREEHQATDPVFTDRIRQNVATVRLGLRMWQRYLASLKIDLEINELASALDEAQKAALFDGGSKAKDDVDLIIEAMSVMVFGTGPDRPKAGVDFKVAGDRLYLRLMTFYPKFKKWAKEYGFDGEILDAHSFQRRLRQQTYYIDRTSAEMRPPEGGIERKMKVYALDVDRLQECEIDLSGFEIETPDEPDEIPF